MSLARFQSKILDISKCKKQSTELQHKLYNEMRYYLIMHESLSIHMLLSILLSVFMIPDRFSRFIDSTYIVYRLTSDLYT